MMFLIRKIETDDSMNKIKYNLTSLFLYLINQSLLVTRNSPIVQEKQLAYTLHSVSELSLLIRV